MSATSISIRITKNASVVQRGLGDASTNVPERKQLVFKNQIMNLADRAPLLLLVSIYLLLLLSSLSTALRFDLAQHPYTFIQSLLLLVL